MGDFYGTGIEIWAGFHEQKSISTLYFKSAQLQYYYTGSHKEIRSINFPFPYEDSSRSVMGVK